MPRSRLTRGRARVHSEPARGAQPNARRRYRQGGPRCVAARWERPQAPSAAAGARQARETEAGCE
eukprot:12953915-Alexandrium_andersonii.AAC.1